LDLRGGADLSVALRGAHRARGNHWPVPRSADRATPVPARNHLLSVHLHHAETNILLLHMQHDHRGHRRAGARLTATELHQTVNGVRRASGDDHHGLTGGGRFRRHRSVPGVMTQIPASNIGRAPGFRVRSPGVGGRALVVSGWEAVLAPMPGRATAAWRSGVTPRPCACTPTVQPRRGLPRGQWSGPLSKASTFAWGTLASYSSFAIVGRMPWTVSLHPQAEAELRRLPAAERAAVLNAAEAGGAWPRPWVSALECCAGR
jgi:hypothetical protein